MLKRSPAFFIIVFVFYAFFLFGCRKDVPTMPGREIISTDSLSLIPVDSTLTSIKLRIITKSQNPGLRKVKLFRLSDDSTSGEVLISEYPLTNNDTVILDNNQGNGLTLGHEYRYRAMIFDSHTGQSYSVREVIAKTLTLTSDDYIWTQYTFGEFQSQLYGVWASSEKDVYAIGPVVSQGKEYGGMHFDGNKWEIIKDAGGHSAFGFSAGDVWAAGGFLFHFDGSKWTRYGSKIVGDHVEILDTVLFTHGAYLALWGTSGSNLYLGDEGGYIVHWDGMKAHLEDVRSSLPFWDIWGNSADDIYAVSGDIDRGLGELYHFNGSNWSLIKNGVISPGKNNLRGHFNTVWSYNEEELFVGGTFVAREKNQRWTEEAIGFFIEKIRGDKPNNVFACGHAGSIAHYNGKEWTKLQSGANSGILLMGLFAKDDYVYVVGTDGYKAYIYHGKRK